MPAMHKTLLPHKNTYAVAKGQVEIHDKPGIFIEKVFGCESECNTMGELRSTDAKPAPQDNNVWSLRICDHHIVTSVFTLDCLLLTSSQSC